MPGRWRAGRTAGLAAALVMGGGLGGLAGPGLASASASCPVWDGTQPANPADSFVIHLVRSVAVAGSCDVWMVGEDHSGGPRQPLIEHWTGGASWTVVPGPSLGSDAGLFSVSAVSPTDIWAVGSQNSGSNAVPVALHWDGTAWTQKAVPGGNGTTLNAVTAVSATNVWAAGSSNDGSAFLLHYDGTNWTRSQVPSLSPAPGAGQVVGLSGLTAASAHDVWAVGAVGTDSQAVPLALHWDGTAWSQKPTPPGVYTLTAVSASGPDDALAVGYAGHFARTVTLHWDGTGWTQKPSPSPDPSDALNDLFGVVSFSPTSALAVGAFDDSQGLEQSLALHWDGQSWTRVPVGGLGSRSGLDAVAAGPAGVWAAGFWLPAATSPIEPAATVFGTVPDVTGQTLGAAIGTLAGAGLRGSVTEVTPPTVGCTAAAAGTVISTTPPAGTFAQTPVTLTACVATDDVTVPDLTNDPDTLARDVLAGAGLTTGTITRSLNCSVPAGTVVSQNPAAGTTVPRTSAVNLVEAARSLVNGRHC